jgi:hypothetical protein
MVINSEENQIMTNKYFIVVSIMLSVFLAGCSQSQNFAQPPSTMGEDFGNAVRTNTALQVINPQAGQEDMPPMALDGQTAEKAMERYHGVTGEAETERLVEDVGN